MGIIRRVEKSCRTSHPNNFPPHHDSLSLCRRCDIARDLWRVGDSGGRPRVYALGEPVPPATAVEKLFSIDEGYFVSHKYAYDGLPMRCVAFADGRVQDMGPLKNLEDAKSLLTRNGRETVENLDELERP